MAIGHFLAGIGCLVWNPVDNTYLILKRSADKDFAAGMWECVTGRVDQGEGFEDALRREVREEINVAVRPLFLIGTTHFYRGLERPDNELLGVVYCAALDRPADIQISPEHSEYRWITLSQARVMLSQVAPTEVWLAQIIERAALFGKHLPPELIHFNERHGFELG